MICDCDKHDWDPVFNEDGQCDKICKICCVYKSDLADKTTKQQGEEISRRI